MPVLKFRVYWEEEESIYRDILILPAQNFLLFHQAILSAFDFDQKHQATFYRSNDQWQRGREIVLEKDNKQHQTASLMMADTTIADSVRNPGQKFIYVYDYQKLWTFMIELIGVIRDEDHKKTYPYCVKKEGPAPSQYGNKSIVKDQIVEAEEKYDLNNDDPDAGFGEEGDESPEENTPDTSEDFF